LAGIEEITSIKVGALPVPPAAAVKVVRTLLQHHVHDGAAVVAELGGKAVVLNLELLHDLDRGLVVHVGVAALALFRRADGTAVERDLGSGIALPVGDEVGAARVVVGNAGSCGLRHPAGQKYQSEHAAAVQRNIPHVFVRDIRPERSTLGVHTGAAPVTSTALDGSRWCNRESILVCLPLRTPP